MWMWCHVPVISVHCGDWDRWVAASWKPVSAKQCVQGQLNCSEILFQTKQDKTEQNIILRQVFIALPRPNSNLQSSLQVSQSAGITDVVPHAQLLILGIPLDFIFQIIYNEFTLLLWRGKKYLKQWNLIFQNVSLVLLLVEPCSVGKSERLM